VVTTVRVCTVWAIGFSFLACLNSSTTGHTLYRVLV
jgi:hypothetical protein